MRLKLRHISTLAKEAHTISDYKKVRDSHDIALRLADYLEASSPKQYPPGHRAGTISRINDILQGRAAQKADELFSEITAQGNDPDKGNLFCQDIQDFLRQKRLLTQPTPYHRAEWASPPERLPTIGYEPAKKVIDQKIYDEAVARGFPPSFFKESFFDHVTLYCVPDYMTCARSVFQDCKFSVCRLCGIDFSGASLYSTDFATALMDDVLFDEATLAHTRFFDCNMSRVSFEDARLKSCRMLDCTLERAAFRGATLDGCAFDRMQVKAVTGLYAAVITQGGATEDECRHNRESVFRALRPSKPLPHEKTDRAVHAR